MRKSNDIEGKHLQTDTEKHASQGMTYESYAFCHMYVRGDRSQIIMAEHNRKHHSQDRIQISLSEDKKVG